MRETRQRKTRPGSVKESPWEEPSGRLVMRWLFCNSLIEDWGHTEAGRLWLLVSLTHRLDMTVCHPDSGPWGSSHRKCGSRLGGRAHGRSGKRDHWLCSLWRPWSRLSLTWWQRKQRRGFHSPCSRDWPGSSSPGPGSWPPPLWPGAWPGWQPGYTPPDILKPFLFHCIRRILSNDYLEWR